MVKNWTVDWSHSVLEQIWMGGRCLGQRLPRGGGLCPMGLESAWIEVPHIGSHYIKFQKLFFFGLTGFFLRNKKVLSRREVGFGCLCIEERRGFRSGPKFFGIFWNFFGFLFLNFLEDLFGGIVLAEFFWGIFRKKLGGFFWVDFFGRIFWEDFFGRNSLGGIT